MDTLCKDVVIIIADYIEHSDILNFFMNYKKYSKYYKYKLTITYSKYCNFLKINSNGLQIESLYYNSNNPLPVGLPKSLKNINFCDEFNDSIDSLPDLITSIQLGKYFNNTINKLPKTLIAIKFGDNFNRILSHIKFSSTLKYITFGKNYSQPVSELPDSLVQIILPERYRFQLLDYSEIFNKCVFFTAHNENIGPKTGGLFQLVCWGAADERLSNSGKKNSIKPVINKSDKKLNMKLNNNKFKYY